MGITEQDLPNLFARYYRGSNAQGFVGTGVGLYLVKTVAGLHGGDVTAQSTQGQGACFTLSLPIAVGTEAS
jgi:signal transduction histidine kinase